MTIQFSPWHFHLLARFIGSIKNSILEIPGLCWLSHWSVYMANDGASASSVFSPDLLYSRRSCLMIRHSYRVSSQHRRWYMLTDVCLVRINERIFRDMPPWRKRRCSFNCWKVHTRRLLDVHWSTYTRQSSLDVRTLCVWKKCHTFIAMISWFISLLVINIVFSKFDYFLLNLVKRHECLFSSSRSTSDQTNKWIKRWPKTTLINFLELIKQNEKFPREKFRHHAFGYRCWPTCTCL